MSSPQQQEQIWAYEPLPTSTLPPNIDDYRHLNQSVVALYAQEVCDLHLIISQQNEALIIIKNCMDNFNHVYDSIKNALEEEQFLKLVNALL